MTEYFLRRPFRGYTLIAVEAESIAEAIKKAEDGEYEALEAIYTFTGIARNVPGDN